MKEKKYLLEGLLITSVLILGVFIGLFVNYNGLPHNLALSDRLNWFSSLGSFLTGVAGTLFVVISFLKSLLSK